MPADPSQRDSLSDAVSEAKASESDHARPPAFLRRLMAGSQPPFPHSGTVTVYLFTAVNLAYVG